MITCPGCGSVNDETKSIYCENCGLQITGSPPAQKSSAFLLQNRYEVLNIIKSGAMGAVYKALDTRLNSVVAVKKMFNKGSDPAEILKMEEMFRREAEILVSLDYPGLPRVIDYFTDSDENGVNSNFLVMTFIDGYDLETYLVKNPAPLPYKKAMGIFNGILDILDYLHSLNPPVVYRDLKPSNVMIRDGKVCLVDFGIAKAIEPGRKGTMMGTAGYASPDQIKGFDTPANDVYSLGVLMHYLFTGKNPEDENRPMFIFEPVRDLNRKVPEHISSLVESMVNIVSSQRPQSAEAVIEILKNEMYFYDDEDTPEEDDSALPSLSISFKVLDNNLLVAAEKGDYETVKECVRKGADVNTQTASGATPLFIAAKKGYRNIVSYLLLMHANFKIADSKGLTPLHIAANNGHKEIAHILAESGADINWKSQDGNTPLDLAVMRGRWDIFRAMKNIGEYAPAPQKNTDTDSNAELEKKVKSMVLLVMGVIALIASGSIISSMADYGILKEEKPRNTKPYQSDSSLLSEASGNGESTESIEFKKAVKDRDTRAIIKLAGGGANGVNISAAIMHFLVYITKGDVSSIYSDKLICNDYIPTFSSDNDLFMLAKDLNAGRAYINNIVNLQITFKEQQGNNLVFRVKFNLGGSVSDDSPIKTDQDYEFDFYMLMENGNWKIAGIRKG